MVEECEKREKKQEAPAGETQPGPDTTFQQGSANGGPGGGGGELDLR